MGLGKQAHVLTSTQLAALVRHAATGRAAARNRVIVQASFKAGLRAKEIAGLRWRMVTDVTGQLARALTLEDVASKGRSGRSIPLHLVLRQALAALWTPTADPNGFVMQFHKGSRDPVQRSETVQKLFRGWYRALGFSGASSHSGRRTFITAAAKQAGAAGGSLRDVQALAGHASLAMTQRYIDVDTKAQRRIVAGL